MDLSSPFDAGPGESGGMAAAIKAFDWASTPLGPVETWPGTLRHAVGLCVHATHAAVILWGPEYRMVYNDAFAAGPAARLANALGIPAYEIFKEIWSTLLPQMEEVVATGKGFTSPEQMLPTMRNGVEEEICWSFSLTPIFGEDGKVLGIFSPGFEITRNVLADRRLSFQITLADNLRGLNNPDEMKRVATELLGQYLDVMRVGYADIDWDQKSVFVETEWTRDDDTRSLAGRRESWEAFGDGVEEFLRAQEVTVVSDMDSSPGFAGCVAQQLWKEMCVKALIVAPIVRDGDLKAVLYVHAPTPRTWRRSEISIVRDVAERTRAEVARAMAERSLRESEDHYRHTVELNPQVTWTALPSGELNRIGPRWTEWTGESGLGDDWLNALHPDDRKKSREAWAKSVGTGNAFDVEHRIKRRDGRYRWIRSRAFPRSDDNGRILLWYGSTEDIHEQKMGEELQRLLINELNHRVKNTLSTVQAIAFQTLKRNSSVEDAHNHFESRLLALSRTHDLLTERSWEGAPLQLVLADAIEHLAEDPGRFTITGDPIWLAPRAALAFALAFHELTTNAAKYGALSGEKGAISINWELQDDDLRLDWQERGGPSAADPKPGGFGSRLIESGLKSELGGDASLRFAPEGLSCTIRASLAIIQGQEDELA